MESRHPRCTLLDALHSCLNITESFLCFKPFILVIREISENNSEDYQWDVERSESIKTQKLLFKYLTEIFPRSNLQLDYVSTMNYKKTKKPMQFDVFFPVLNLAFEYQGGQHYFRHYLYGALDEIQVEAVLEK